jgi:hypothetical protein
LRAAASGLRSGSLTMDEAMRIMGTVEKLH